MENHIENLGRSLARGMGRKDAIKTIAKGVGAALLGAVGFASAKNEAAAGTNNCGCINGRCCTYKSRYGYWDCGIGNRCASYGYCGANC